MLAGDVEVDEVLANNDVGDAVTVISDLKIHTTKRENILESRVFGKIYRIIISAGDLPGQSLLQRTRTRGV